MKKILILTNNLNGGGAEKVLLTLLDNMSPLKYDITLQLVYKSGFYLNSVPQHIKTKYIFENSTDALDLITNHSDIIYEQYVRNDCDIEIAFLEGNATKILSKSTNDKSKKIAWVHIDLSSEHYTKNIYYSVHEELLAYSAFDKIAFVSNGALNGFEFLFGTSLHNRSIVVYNPIDYDNIIEKSTMPLFEEKKKLTLCAIGRLVHQKGYDYLLLAIADLIKDGYDFDLWVLGVGKLEKELRAMCQDLHLTDHVTFCGFQENPYNYINVADAFICSSRTEGLPLVIGEALALEKPIISTKCTGSVEVLTKGNWGILVEPTKEGLYYGIKKYLDNPAAIPILNTQSMGVFEHFYGLKTYMSRIETLLLNA